MSAPAPTDRRIEAWLAERCGVREFVPRSLDVHSWPAVVEWVESLGVELGDDAAAELHSAAYPQGEYRGRP